MSSGKKILIEFVSKFVLVYWCLGERILLMVVVVLMRLVIFLFLMIDWKVDCIWVRSLLMLFCKDDFEVSCFDLICNVWNFFLVCLKKVVFVNIFWSVFFSCWIRFLNFGLFWLWFIMFLKCCFSFFYFLVFLNDWMNS